MTWVKPGAWTGSPGVQSRGRVPMGRSRLRSRAPLMLDRSTAAMPRTLKAITCVQPGCQASAAARHPVSNPDTRGPSRADGGVRRRQSVMFSEEHELDGVEALVLPGARVVHDDDRAIRRRQHGRMCCRSDPCCPSLEWIRDLPVV